MTVFNVNGDRPAVWFDLEGGGRVQLRTMTADVLKAIRAQSVKKRTEYKRVEGKAERFEVEEVNDDLQNELFWDHVIVGWENFFDGQGAAIPCTKENKVLLMSRSARFATVVGESLRTLNEAEAVQARALEKNS